MQNADSRPFGSLSDRLLVFFLGVDAAVRNDWRARTRIIFVEIIGQNNKNGPFNVTRYMRLREMVVYYSWFCSFVSRNK